MKKHIFFFIFLLLILLVLDGVLSYFTLYKAADFSQKNILFYSVLGLFNLISILLLIFYLIQAKKSASYRRELSMTREELSTSLKEMDDYTKDLENKNKTIADMEEQFLDDQGQLEETLSELTLYVQQLEDVFNYIDVGICTIDKSYKIESNFNKGFLAIFGEKEYWERSIFDSIFYNLSDNIKSELRDFLDVAINNPTTSTSMLNDASPIQQFTYIYNQDGKVKDKIIQSKIIRILDAEGNINKLMFLFNDITIKLELEKEIEEQEKSFEDDFFLLTVIFNNDIDVILDFMKDLTERIELIKEKGGELKQGQINTEIIQQLIAITHSIKGEAFSLGFTFLADISKDFENFLKKLVGETVDIDHSIQLLEYSSQLETRLEKLNKIADKLFAASKSAGAKQRDAIGVDLHKFDEFVKHFNKIIDNFNSGKLQKDTLLQFKENMEKLTWLDLSPLEKELEIITEKSAVSQNKRAKLVFMSDEDSLPALKYKYLKEIFIHLIRNSLAHGIEEPGKRKELNKDETGKINIHLYRENDTYIVMYSDDGAGFNLEKIKAKALKEGLISNEDLSTLTEEDIIYLVFKDGFSTSEGKDMVSGVGVGMSVVKNNITNFLHGKMSIKNRIGKGFTLKFSFPK